MLELRLEELNNIVDKFIIVESIFTFSGKSKELHFWNNKDRFEKYKDKIIHIIHKEMPKLDNAWYNESSQRNAIKTGLDLINLEDSDLVIISDCDEICNPKKLEWLKDFNLNQIINVEMDFYYYNLECLNNDKWFFPKIIPFSIIKNISEIDKLRYFKTNSSLMNGGWHFSYFGNTKTIINKIKSFSHQEFNNDYYLNEENIEKFINEKKDLFYRNDVKFSKIKLSENKNLPKNYKILVEKFDYKYEE